MSPAGVLFSAKLKSLETLRALGVCFCVEFGYEGGTTDILGVVVKGSLGLGVPEGGKAGAA